MKNITVHDKAIVLVLTKPEAKALNDRLKQHTGIQKPKALLKAETKLAVARGEI